MSYGDPAVRNMSKRQRAEFIAQRQSVQFDKVGDVKQQSVTYGPKRKRYTPLPGAVLKQRSTLVDAENRIIQSWQIEKPEAQQLEEWARALAEQTKPIELLPVPMLCAAMDHQIACYPVGDHHMGMLSWKYETGDSYDLDIGEQLLERAVNYLVHTVPATERALIVFLGDFMHYDSMIAITPGHGNPLDADGRFPKMVRATIRAMRRMIEHVAARHREVHVIIEIGNHDLASSIWLMEGMHNIYENNPRITIDTSPRHFHYVRYGNTLVGVHHGHGVKPEALPGVMAADRAQDWGLTTHRYWWTGHVHSKRSWDFPGVSVESFRILPPADAWASNQGYRSHRDMTAIVLDDEFGEVARHRVNPDMLR